MSLPELPLLAVLPGTGGLTRLVDKRGVRRDRADVFCTLEEGVRAPRALEWGLVDAIAPPSEFRALVERESVAAAGGDASRGVRRGVALESLEPEVGERELVYRHVRVALDAERRVAELTVARARPAGAASRSSARAPRCGWRASSTTRCCACACTSPSSVCGCCACRATRGTRARSTGRSRARTGSRARCARSWRAC